MTRNELIEELAALSQAEPGSVTENQLLETLPVWDSLATTEFRMLAEDQLGLELDGLLMEKAQTVADLLALVADRLDD